MVLLDLCSQGTVTPMLYAQIVEQLLCSNQQEMAMMQYHAMSMMFHNSNHVRYLPRRASPNLPQFILPRNEVTVNPPFNIVSRNEVTVNPPFDIIDTHTLQQSILSQLSVPNSQSSNPINQVPARQQ
jgi:hypothetical protein